MIDPFSGDVFDKMSESLFASDIGELVNITIVARTVRCITYIR